MKGCGGLKDHISHKGQHHASKDNVGLKEMSDLKENTGFSSGGCRYSITLPQKLIPFT